MASELGWGGIPMISPSTLATRYLLYEKVIPERCIEPGQRYRARKNLDEHVRGYRIVKKSLQRCLAEIEFDRKHAHVDEPYMDKVKKWTIYYRDESVGGTGEFKRPNGAAIHCCHKNTRSSKPMLIADRCITLLTEPRSEEFLGLVDIRKKMRKNPSEALKKD